MDFVKSMTGGGSGDNDDSKKNSSSDQKNNESGGGGFLSGIGNKLNAAAGGGRESEKNEDYLDKGEFYWFFSFPFIWRLVHDGGGGRGEGGWQPLLPSDGTCHSHLTFNRLSFDLLFSKNWQIIIPRHRLGTGKSARPGPAGQWVGRRAGQGRADFGLHPGSIQECDRVGYADQG